MLFMPLREKNKILAQKSPGLTKKIKCWLIVLCSLPLFGMVTAFGIVPKIDIDESPIETEAIVRDLSIPTLAPNKHENSTFSRQEYIQRGDTMAAILARLDVRKEDRIAFLHAARESKAMRQLRPGRTVHAKTTATGELLTLRYYFGQDELFLIEKVDNRFQMKEQPIELESHVQMRAGTVNSSLFAATDHAGVPGNVAAQIIEIFASDIDFHRDIRTGDRFKVVYETLHNNGEQTKTGKVLAVEYVNKGKAHQAFLFQTANDKGGYYTADGKSLRKQFLRSPLAFSRISSGFSNSRFHPVLKKWRSHKGIDYAAPTGTPIKATAKGTVRFAGTKGGYGKLIVLRHNNKYDTAYGHLSKFAKGLRNGKKIEQGDIIGYVGATGLATGPHLHYELRVNGAQRDPATIVLPDAPPIATKNMPTFFKETKPLVARLNVLRNQTQLALK